MIKINDYATKNHLNEWEIKELPESEVYRLDLQDFSIIFALPKFDKLIKLFIPTPTKHIIAFSLNTIFANIYHNSNHGIQIFFIDVNNVSTMSQYKNIIPNWSKYIAKDNTVLFLSEEDGRKYGRAMGLNWFYWFNKNSIDSRSNWNLWTNKYPIDRQFITENTFFDIKKEEAKLKEYYNLPKESKKISIIIPSIHSKNIQEISNIVKDLKENYGVEYVEVIATHCYLKENKFVKYDYTGGYKGEASFRYNNINKIITTDSTGDLEAQDCANFKVINCKEFFNL